MNLKGGMADARIITLSTFVRFLSCVTSSNVILDSGRVSSSKVTIITFEGFFGRVGLELEKKRT